MRKGLLIVSTLLLLLPCALLAGLFYSEAGLALIAGQLGRLERFGIHVEGVSGTLAGPLKVARFELDHPLVQVVSHDIVLDLQLRALVFQTLRTSRLTARNTQVLLHAPQTASRRDKALHFLPVYLRIDARGVELSEVRYVHMNGTEVSAHHLQGEALIGRRYITIKNVRIDAERFDVAGRLRLRGGRMLALYGSAAGHLRMQPGVEYALSGRLDGPLDRLAIQAEVHTGSEAAMAQPNEAGNGKSARTQARTELLLTRPEGRWHLAGQLAAAGFSLDPWLDDAPFSLQYAALEIDADAQRVKVVGTLAIPEYDSGAISIEASGSYAHGQLRIAAADLALAGTPAKVHAAGSISFQDHAPLLDLQARWQMLQWPLRTTAVEAQPAHAVQAPRLLSPAGTLDLHGRAPYEFRLTAEVEGPQIPAAQGSARGRLSALALDLEHFDLALLEGHLRGAARLQLGEPRAWQISFQAEDINPLGLHAAMPGRLEGRIRASGIGLDERLSFTLLVEELTGRLRAENLHVRGMLSRTRSAWTVRDARLDYADAGLRLDARLGERIEARWVLNAPHLERLWPGLQGAFASSGSAAGAARTPQIVADARGTALQYRNWALRSLRFDLAADTAANDSADRTDAHEDHSLDGSAPGGQALNEAVSPDPATTSAAPNAPASIQPLSGEALAPTGDSSIAPASQLHLRILGLAHGEARLEAADISAVGTTGEHRMDVELAGIVSHAGARPSQARMRIDGHYAQGRWEALLAMTRLSLGLPEVSISVPEQVHIVASADQVTVGELCLIADGGHLCAEGHWASKGSWQAMVAGYEIPLALLLPWHMSDAEFAGRVEGRVRLHGSSGQPWQAEAGMRIVDAAILYRPQAAETETLNLGTGGLAATVTPQHMDFSFGMQAFTDTYLYANARLVRDGSDLLQLPLLADVRARAADANILPLFFPEVDHAAGLFTADLGIRGTLAQPELRGHLTLADGEFDSYRINLALRELSVNAALSGNRLDLQAAARAGEGRLGIDGRLAWRGGESRGKLRLRGQDLLVADLPDYRVIASPDLEFRIDARHIGITGEVLIPSARIQPVQLGSTVRVADDARYVGEHAAATAEGYGMHSEVRIVMGDDVRIEAFGLQGRMQGAVGTILHSGDTPRGRGELSVADGHYEAYGQKLDISRGRLLFDSSSLDDPGLDMEARRDVDGVTVGLNVRGTLREPRLTFFSDPSMPQTQIVSYLLTGRSMDTMRSADRTMMDSARGSLAYQGGGLLASQLGRRLGFEEVGVESTIDSTGADQASLVIGKFLSPRLFISYGISLTESINTLKLRYTISDRWILRTEAGESQSADLEYTIER